MIWRVGGQTPDSPFQRPGVGMASPESDPQLIVPTRPPPRVWRLASTVCTVQDFERMETKT